MGQELAWDRPQGPAVNSAGISECLDALDCSGTETHTDQGSSSNEALVIHVKGFLGLWGEIRDSWGRGGEPQFPFSAVPLVIFT